MTLPFLKGLTLDLLKFLPSPDGNPGYAPGCSRSRPQCHTRAASASLSCDVASSTNLATNYSALVRNDEKTTRKRANQRTSLWGGRGSHAPLSVPPNFLKLVVDSLNVFSFGIDLAHIYREEPIAKIGSKIISSSVRYCLVSACFLN